MNKFSMLVIFSMAVLSACVSQAPLSNSANSTAQTASSIHSEVYIIHFEIDKKSNIINEIAKNQDEIIYDYKNLGGMMAVKISADDLAGRIEQYRQIDGVLQINKDQIVHLH